MAPASPLPHDRPPLRRPALRLVAACGDDGSSAPPPSAEVDDTADEPGGQAERVPAEEPFSGYDDHVPDQYAGTSNWICHPALGDPPTTPRSIASTPTPPPRGTRAP